ncbi:MAG: peptidylprolyl isomerase [Leptolyngbyaceae cyanobacterium CSU_1_3]|nr:peptidylprolyl isomerase [Leptolyngbyaceae cyanobacterium CSU_1_3]
MQTKIRNWFLSALAVALFAIVGCNSQASSSAPASPSASPTTTAAAPDPGVSASSPQTAGLPRLEGKATVVMTVKGSPITIDVDGTDAPVTAGNFVDLVERKVYDGLVFHRVVREPQPFVVQGGDPQGKNPNFPLEQLGTGGFTDPTTNQARNIPLEIKPEKASDAIVYSKILDSGAPKLKHTRGAVAMARSAFPDSASSQFYFALSDLQFLDGSYAVFGYVTQGMEVVDKIQQGDRIESAKVTKGLESLKK